MSNALFCKLFICNKDCFSLTGKFKFEATKFIRKELLSIFFIANEASDGMFGFLFMISKDKSLIESIIELNSEFYLPGFSSG